MMLKRRYVPILALGALAACLAGTILAAGQATSSGYHEFTMTVKNFECDPGVITVKKGQKVRLIITSTDRELGIKLDPFDINQDLPMGDPTTIEFTAGKAGAFEFKCSMNCGKGHGKLKGKLVVEE